MCDSEPIVTIQRIGSDVISDNKKASLGERKTCILKSHLRVYSSIHQLSQVDSTSRKPQLPIHLKDLSQDIVW